MEERAIKSWPKENRPPVEELSSLGQEAPLSRIDGLPLVQTYQNHASSSQLITWLPAASLFILLDSVGTFGPGEDIHSQCQDLYPVSSRLLAAADNKTRR